MKILFTLLLTLLLVHRYDFAQNETNHWMFGTSAGLDFSTGNPVSEQGCVLGPVEGASSISDPVTGNLLMYTNGVTVYDATHASMPNGTGLNGNVSSTQASLIVPKHGSSTLFYIFTTDAEENAGVLGCNYTVVDMSLNGGLGDVIVTQKNVFLFAPCSEQLSAVKHANCNDWWIMAKEDGTDVYKAYLLTNSGVSGPVNSAVGISTPSGSCGQAKFSPDGTKYAIATSPNVFSALIQLFDFDNTTGLLSNPITLVNTTGETGYGLSFSGNSSKLYITRGYAATKLYQYDLSSGGAAAIVASGTFIDNLNPAQFQLGKDFKIYIANGTPSNVSVINNPNALGAACGFNVGVIPVAGLFGNICNFPDSYFNETSPCVAGMSIVTQSTNIQCRGGNDGTASVQVYNNNGPYTVSWSPGGATTDTITNLAQGIYTVTVTDAAGTVTSASVTITDPAPFDVSIVAPNDSVCINSSVTLNASYAGGTPAYSYQWSTGSALNTTSLVMNVSKSVYVNVTDAYGCTAADSLFIVAISKPTILFTATPKNGCNPLQIEFTNTSTAATAHWDFGDGQTSNTWSPVHTYTASDCHTINLSVTSAQGCVADTSLTNYICVWPSPTANFTFTPSLLNPAGNTVVHFDNKSQFGNTYLWDFPGGQHSTDGDPDITIDVENDHDLQVCLSVVAVNGCSDTVCHELPVEKNDNLYLPNSFSPNNDNINDVFKPVIADVGIFITYELLIFDRYGQVIFTAYQSDQGWDGQYKGKKCQDDIYTWKVRFHISGKQTQEQTGHVTLLR